MLYLLFFILLMLSQRFCFVAFMTVWTFSCRAIQHEKLLLSCLAGPSANKRTIRLFESTIHFFLTNMIAEKTHDDPAFCCLFRFWFLTYDKSSSSIQQWQQNLCTSYLNHLSCFECFQEVKKWLVYHSISSSNTCPSECLKLHSEHCDSVRHQCWGSLRSRSHGHGVFILATSSKGKWTTNPTPSFTQYPYRGTGLRLGIRHCEGKVTSSELALGGLDFHVVRIMSFPRHHAAYYGTIQD